MQQRTPAILLVLSALTSACDDARKDNSSDATSAADTTGTGDTADSIGDEPQLESVAGSVQLTEQRTAESGVDGYPRVSLKFNAEPSPFLREVDRRGECRLLTFANSFCDPACVDGLCLDGSCVPYPAGLDVGAVTITGRETSVFEPLADSGNFYASDHYPDDLFVTGSAVTVEASGGELAPFTLATIGPAPLETPLLDQQGDLTVAPDEDYRVTWTPAEATSRVRLTLHPHGPHGFVEAAVIECDSADDGLITVDGALFAPFLTGWGGCGECPASTLVRYHRDAMTVAGKRIELVVGSQVDLYLEREP